MKQTPRRVVVHYDVLLGDDDDISLCGLEVFDNPTLDEKEVTCKRCKKILAKRRKEKR